MNLSAVRSEHDVLIVGGGAAGLTLALHIAATRRVTLLNPVKDGQGASRWAQGGIAAVLSPEDDIDAHVADTLVAGDGLCDERAVRFTVEQGDRKSTRLNSSHVASSYAVLCSNKQTNE